jgi:small GTP-binding protein
MKQETPKEFKIKFFGEPGCGKTALLAALMEVDPDSQQMKEEEHVKVQEIDGKNITLKFYDMIGSSKDATGKKEADILVLCFSVDSYSNFGALMSKMGEARTHAKNNAASVLVGTKIDLRDESLMDPVLSTDHDALRQSIAAKCYVETSAKNNSGIQDVMDEILKIVKEKMKGRQNPIRYKVGKKVEHVPDNIGNDFAQIMNDQSTSDVILSIIVDPETGEKYSKYCHRLVLAARSPVFKAMFYGGIRNNEPEIFLNENIRDKRVIDQFVTFIYTNQIPLEKDAEETVIPLLTLADEYGTTRLKEACGAFALDKINENNWLDLYEVAKTYNEQSLVDDCLSFAAENIEPVLLDSKHYLTLSQDVLIDLLQRDDIACDEMTLFDMVVEWYEHQSNDEHIFERPETPDVSHQASEPNTPSSVLSSVAQGVDLQKVMSHIRWVLMGPQKLIVDMKKHIGKYLSMQDYENAIEFFAMPRKYKAVNDKKFKFRRGLCPFVWDCSSNNFVLSNEDRTITKHGSNNWDLVAFSSIAMESGLQYWQVKVDSINSDKSGMSIGLTSDRNIRPDHYTVGTTLGCAGSAYGVICVPNGSDYVVIGGGDVVGFLVDFIQDEIKIYKNGRQIFRGTHRPSDLKQIYATVFLYYNGDQVSLVNDYPLSMLE